MSTPAAADPSPPSPTRLPRRVTFNETLSYDDGLVPVRSKTEPLFVDVPDHASIGVELGDVKKDKGKAVTIEDAQSPTGDDAPEVVESGRRKRRRRRRKGGVRNDDDDDEEEGDSMCGLRRRTVLILSVVAALIIGALLGGIAGGLIAHRRVSQSPSPQPNGPPPAEQPSSNPFPTTERSQPPAFPTTEHVQPTATPIPGSRAGSTL